MRIRVLDGQYIFTFKYYTGEEVREYEFPVAELSLYDKRIQAIFKEFKLQNVSYSGSAVTKRYLKEYPEAVLCLDLNSYLGIVDYELEFELKDPRKDELPRLIALLKEFALPYRANKISKFQRFQRRKKECGQ